MQNHKFVLTCCSTVDLSKERLDERNIPYVCFHYFLDGVEHVDDLYATSSADEFYKKMVEGADTKTAQVNVDEFINFFEPILKDGKDVLHISFSSGLSGSYNSACIAIEELSEKYPDRKILIVDSLGASSGYGLFVELLADMRDLGATAEEAYDWAILKRLNIQTWFFSTDLTFYIKGGRVSKLSGWFGTALKICPLLNMNREGKLIPREKIRTKPRVIKAIVDKMSLFAKNGENYSGRCYISHSACREDAEAVKALVEERFKKVKSVEIFDIGSVIGSHTGPGTVALFYEGVERED